MKTTITSAALLIAITLASAAQAAPSSGMLLGVYAFSNYQGLRVTGTIHGYSAQGRLFPGDVLRRVTADGIHIYPTRNHWQIEHAKDRIGPFTPASLEIFRPGVGIIYMWVEFQPVGGVAAFSVNGQPMKKQFKAQILTEKEKPGAAKLFQGGIQHNPQPGPAPVPKPFPKPFPKPLPNVGGSGSAASLFGQ